MKIAILSDIHGNVFALKSVLDSIANKGIDKLLVTGDFVGYYFWPVDVFNLLKDWNMVAIAGNHDRMLKLAKSDKKYRQKILNKYGSGIDIALKTLDVKTLNWLMNLPIKIEYDTGDGCVLLCHGSPWDEDEYIYPDTSDKSFSRYSNLSVKWVIQGHTHYPMFKRTNSLTLINPGSVGQPRNKEIGAQWAQLDTITNKVDFFCEPYDVQQVVEASKKRHPELPYLASILERI